MRDVIEGTRDPAHPGFCRMSSMYSVGQKQTGEEFQGEMLTNDLAADSDEALHLPLASPEQTRTLTVSPTLCGLRPFKWRWVPICTTSLVAVFCFYSHAAKLGTQLADLHLDNKRLGETLQKEAGTVGMAVGPRDPPQRKTSGQYGCVGGVVLPLCTVRPVLLPQERNVNPKAACLGWSEHSEYN